MVLLTTVGIEPARDFPYEGYERAHARLTPFANSPKVETWRQFGLAWNAVAYRHKACSDCDEAFRDLYDRLGPSAGGLDRYYQQRDLYGCVVNACSVIESFYYAAYAIGALLDDSTFPINTAEAQRAIDPEKTVTRYDEKFAGDGFTTVLSSAIQTTDWVDLKKFRNVLVHRAAPGKAVFLSGEGAPVVPDQLRLGDFHLVNRPLDGQVTKDSRDAMTRALVVLCDGLADFVDRHFVDEG